MISILGCIFGSKEKLKKLAKPQVKILIDLLVFYPFVIGFIIYSVYKYSQFNNNEKLNDLESIESDDFIKNFIKEFIYKYKENNTIIILTMIIMGSASILNIVSFIITFFVKEDKDIIINTK